MTNFIHGFRKSLCVTGKRVVGGAAVVSLAACSGYQGPSVPSQQGMNLYDAQTAVETCAVEAPRGGHGAVVGSYVFGILFFGVLVGTVGAAANQENTRLQGEADAVDKCLKELGYERRDLTAEEYAALKKLPDYQRKKLLSHFVSGGTLDTF